MLRIADYDPLFSNLFPPAVTGLSSHTDVTCHDITEILFEVALKQTHSLNIGRHLFMYDIVFVAGMEEGGNWGPSGQQGPGYESRVST